jgi:hypothetical protein
MHLNAVEEEISRVKKAGHESVFYRVWNTILTWQFPATEG